MSDVAQSLEELILLHNEIRQAQSELTSTVKSATLVAANDESLSEPVPLRPTAPKALGSNTGKTAMDPVWTLEEHLYTQEVRRHTTRPDSLVPAR